MSTNRDKEKHRIYQKKWREKHPESVRRTSELCFAKAILAGKPWAVRKQRDGRQVKLFWKRRLNPNWLCPIAEIMRRLWLSVPKMAPQIGVTDTYIYFIFEGVIHPSEEMMQRLQVYFAERGEFLDIQECWPDAEEPIELPPHFSEKPRRASERELNHHRISYRSTEALGTSGIENAVL